MEVAFNPADPFAWLGLAGDAVDLVPFVTGVGETIRALKTTAKVTEEADVVIDTYRNLKKVNKGNDLEVHHIVEKRFSPELGYNKTGSQMPSIALSKTEHRNYTNLWRKNAPYSKAYKKKQLLEAALKVYENEPKLLGASIFTITKMMNM